MDFCQCIKKPRFWVWLICFLVFFFLIFLMTNTSGNDSPILTLTRFLTLAVVLLPVAQLIGRSDPDKQAILCLISVAWGALNCIFYIVDIIAIFEPSCAVFMPRSPSNFLGYFLFGLFPSRPLAGFLLAKTFAILLMAVALLLAYQDKPTEAQENQNIPEDNCSICERRRAMFEGTRVTEANLGLLRLIYGPHVNLDDAPPSYSSLNLSESNEDDMYLPTYEEKPKEQLCPRFALGSKTYPVPSF